MINRFSVLVFRLCPIILALLSGCKPAAENKTVSSDALAIVNGRSISENTFRHWWKKDLPATDSSETRQTLLAQLIQRSALVQKAQSAGLDRDPEMVEAIESLLIARLKEKALQPKIEAINITDEEIFTFYQSHKEERYAEPDRVHVAVLWFETRGQEPLVARYRPRLEKAREQILTTVDQYPVKQGFGALAVENSEHAASRYRGGNIGWIETAKQDEPWRKAIAEIAAGLTQPGQVSEVAVRPEGVFVVRLIERRSAQFREFATVRADIIRHLRNEKRSLLEREFFAKIERGSVVQQRPKRLSALTDLPTQTRPAFSTNPTQITLHKNP